MSRPRQFFEPLERRLLFVIPGTDLGDWDDYATLTAELQTIHATYPGLTQLQSIGQTVQGRQIWALRITDNPTIEEDEPEFLLQGSIHGNEPVGMEMSFYFAQHLLENYPGDARIRDLVDTTDIWIIPNVNWDGYAIPQRGNFNGVDLNRNFPEWTTTSLSPFTRYLGAYGNMFDGPAAQTALLEPEAVAVMNFRIAHNFVASASLHTGQTLVSYPWSTNGNVGSDYAASPDDALFRQLALTYALNNPVIAANPVFPNGITNGDAWYPLTGGEKDWAYLYTGCLETTMELSVDKFPPAATLAAHWNDNREAMLRFAEAVHWGVRGVITDALTGSGIDAKITVVSPAPSPSPDPNHPATVSMFSDGGAGEAGDYHRVLLPGTYTLRFEAPGYVTQTLAGVVVAQTTTSAALTARLNIAMTPIDTTPPAVESDQFLMLTAPQSLQFTFSEDVSASLSASDLLLENITTGQTIPAAQIHLAGYDGASNAATFTFPSFAFGALPSGAYRATLPAGSVTDAAGNPLAADHVFNFSFLAGDANFDNRVDSDDFNILAANFGLTSRNYSHGDFNYDALVSSDDFNILATNFGIALGTSPFSAMRFALARQRRVIETRDDLETASGAL